MSELKNIPCVVRGFHYYCRYWTSYLGEELIRKHDDSNPFDVFVIKTYSQENGRTYVHLPKEISRATKFLIDSTSVLPIYTTTIVLHKFKLALKSPADYLLNWPWQRLKIICWSIDTNKF